MNPKLTRVLLIEDNPGDARLIREMLKEAGGGQYDLDCADRLSTGLERLTQQRPDIILLDLGLPDSQGLDTLARVLGTAAGIPVVVLTGLDDEPVGMDAVRKGAQDYLVKGQVFGKGTILRRVMNYAVERKQAEERILHQNETLKVIRNINQLIVQVDSEPELLEKACQELITGRNYKMTWCGLTQDGTYEVKVAAQAGTTGVDYLSAIKVTWDDSIYGRGPTGTAIKSGKTAIVRDIAKECTFCPWHKQALKAGCQSVIALPLKIEKKVFGTLNIYSSHTDAFDKDEVDFLTEMASDVSLGIQRIRLIEEQKRAEAEIFSLSKFPAENPNPILRVNRDGNILYANPSSASLLKLWKCQVGKRLPKPHLEMVARILQSQKAETVEVDCYGIIYAMLFVPVANADYVNLYSRDITEIRQGEEKIIQTAREWETTFNSITDLVSIHDKDFKLVKVNKAFAETFKMKTEELVGKVCYQVVHGTNEPVPNCPYRKALETRKSVVVEYFEPHLGIHLEVTASPIFNAKGEVVGCVHVTRDITDRKKAEEELQKFKTITDQAGYGATVADVEGVFSYVNEAFARMHGYTPEELVGEHYSILYTEEQLKAVKQIREASIKDSSYFAAEIWRKKKDGTVFPTYNTNVIIKDATGKPLYLAVVVMDITERKKAEDEIRKFKTIADNASYAVTIIDMDGKYIYVNESFAAMYGYSAAELSGKPFSIVFKETQDRTLVRKRIEAIASQGNWTGDVRRQKGDGTLFYTLTSATLVKDDNGKPLFIAATHFDLTERKQMEEQLMAQDRLASIGQLVSGVAHEINNPLTGVIGFSEMLLKRDLPDDIKDDLKVINDEAMRTARIVKNLLTFARKQPEGKTAVDTNESIRGVLNLRDHEQKVNNIRVITHFASDLPQVIGNSSQLQQVFFNIVINAEFFMLEAHQKGNLTITTECIGDFVRASLTDDGAGISQKNMKSLFTPFFTTKEVGKGTGLGLSICHGIITEHGGRIYAESELGKGATFIVELPIAATRRKEATNE